MSSESFPSQSGPAFHLPLETLLGRLDPVLFVLPILLAALVLEPSLGLLAVRHGGALK